METETLGYYNPAIYWRHLGITNMIADQRNIKTKVHWVRLP